MSSSPVTLAHLLVLWECSCTKKFLFRAMYWCFSSCKKKKKYNHNQFYWINKWMVSDSLIYSFICWNSFLKVLYSFGFIKFMRRENIKMYFVFRIVQTMYWSLESFGSVWVSYFYWWWFMVVLCLRNCFLYFCWYLF